MAVRGEKPKSQKLKDSCTNHTTITAAGQQGLTAAGKTYNARAGPIRPQVATKCASRAIQAMRAAVARVSPAK